jgi:hypothetical protein
MDLTAVYQFIHLHACFYIQIVGVQVELDEMSGGFTPVLIEDVERDKVGVPVEDIPLVVDKGIAQACALRCWCRAWVRMWSRWL